MSREAGVEPHDGWLRVRFGGSGGHADFHLRWLRHNCDLARHPQTGERMVDSSDLPDALALRDARVAREALEVEWAHDGRISRYWLRERAYALDREEARPPPSRVAELEVASVGDSVVDTGPALARLEVFGAAVVRRAPACGGLRKRRPRP
jgi:gamma-butyrobetaine dioxygenase/trimethyllysine dioxygenase